MNVSSKYRVIRIGSDTYRLLKEYKERTGVTIRFLVESLIKHHLGKGKSGVIQSQDYDTLPSFFDKTAPPIQEREK